MAKAATAVAATPRVSLSPSIITEAAIGDSSMIDPRFVLEPCPLPPRGELEPVLVFVSNAVKNPDSPNYQKLCDGFRNNKKTEGSMLHKLLIALRTAGLSTIASSSSKHTRLIHYIAKLDPFSSPNDDVVHAHFHLLIALVSANSVFAVPTLTSLWKLLIAGEKEETESRYALKIF